MQSKFRDLLAWQRSMDLVDCMYKATRAFPKEERYGLTAQMRDAATSIPSNIAEGQGRHTLRDFRRFLREARGSAHELETQTIIAYRQGFLDERTSEELQGHVGRVLQLINGLIRHINQRLASRPAANGARPT